MSDCPMGSAAPSRLTRDVFFLIIVVFFASYPSRDMHPPASFLLKGGSVEPLV